MADLNAYLSIYVTHVFETSRFIKNPKYSNIFFWAWNDREAGTALVEQLASASKTIEGSPSLVLNDLRKLDMLLASVSGEWVRAIVKDLTISSSGKIEVSCIDYGFSSSLVLQKLKAFPKHLEHLKTIPALASKYCLADVLLGEDDALFPKVDDYLKATIHRKVVRAVLLGKREEYDGARIYYNNQLIAKNLHDLKLVEKGETYEEAVEMPVPTVELTSKPITTVKPNNLSAKNSAAPVGIALPLVNNLSPAPVRKFSSPAKVVPVKNNYCASTLEPDVVHHVIVTHIQKGPWRFTVRRKCPETDFGLADIQQRIDTLTNELLPLIHPQPGTPCIAMSTHDNALHRGLISSIEDVQTFKIYFVDHGSFELVGISKLYQIPRELIALNLLAVRVCLSEAEDLSKFNGVAEKFCKMALNKSFHCRVVDSSPMGPQEVRMFDDSGRNLKDLLAASYTQPQLILDATTPSIFLSAPQQQQSLKSSRPGLVRMDLKIEPPEVDPTEKLFVTYVGPAGQFFGQFEKRTMEDLKAITDELSIVYGKLVADLPLLYSDVRSHMGDFAVVRFMDDVFYRVKVIKEFVNDVQVAFVDYGDVVRVYRHEIWAPVKALKLFTQQPFGINCIVAGVTATREDWQALLIDKSVSVKIGPGMESVYSISFEDEKLNVDLMNANNVGKAKLPHDQPKIVSPAPSVQEGNKKPLPMHTNGKLVLDLSDDKDSSRKRLGPSSVRSSSSVNDFFLAPQITQFPPFGSRSSLESFELKRSPRRPLPIAEPVNLFFPEVKGVDGETMAIEVVHVDSTDSFYCHNLQEVSQLQEMVDRLNEVYSDESKPCMNFAKIDQACVAKYEDGAWYRGKVLEVKESEANILFVDYGNQQRSPINSLKVIDDEFVRLPPQAYHCSLRMVPANEEKAKFEKAVIGKTLKGTFYRLGSDKYDVKLFYEENGERVVINEQFGAPVVDSVPVPSEDFTPLPLNPTPIEVSVTWFYSPNRFFLSPSDQSCYQHYLDELDEFYSSLASNELVEDAPRVGLPCVARFVDDMKYYRAKIMSIKGKVAEVLFVDYGNEQDTPVKELRRITPRFLQFPHLAWECKLKDVKPLPSSSKTHTDSCFMTGAPISAVIHSPASDGYYPVELTVPNVGDVREYLIKNKVVELVVPKQESLITPQSFDFEPGKIIFTEAVVPYVTSTRQFWVQPDHKEAEELMEKLDGLAAKPDFVCNRSFTPAVGKTCLAWFTDERWYRALIEKLEGDSASVFYIDYGNSHTVSTRHLRSLPAEFAQQPAMAYQCRLDGVENAVNCPEINDKFSELVVDDFVTVLFVKNVDNVLQVRLLTKDGADIGEKIGLLKQTREVEAYIPYAKSSSQFWIQLKSDEEKLEQFDAALQEWCNVNAQTVQPIATGVYGVYHPEFETWYRAQVLSVDGDSVEVHFIDYGDTDTIPVSSDNITKLPDKLNQITPFATECCYKGSEVSTEDIQKFSSTGAVLKLVLAGKQGNAEIVESIRLCMHDVLESLRERPSEDDHQELPKAPALKDVPEILYSPNQVLANRGQAVVIFSVWDVWIQAEPTAADDFSTHVTQYVNSPEFARVPYARPTLGGHYLAQFPDDNLWYRAEVTAIENNQVKVVYFDYGNFCVIDANKLKPLPPSLCKYPPFAQKFALDGVENATQPLPDAALCQDALFGKELSVIFVKKTSEHLFVRLLDKHGVDLNEQLGLEKLVDQSVIAQNVSCIQPMSIPHDAIEVIVSHIESNNTFWIQRRSDEALIREIECALSLFDKDLTQVRPLHFIDGDWCVVRHPEKQRLFRGKITYFIDEDIAEVYFVDVGGRLAFRRTELRPCPEMLKLPPHLATECQFLTPIYPDQYSDDLFRAFREATEGFVCHAVFHGWANNGRVETLFANGVDVLSMLSGRLVSSTPQSGKAILGNNFPVFANGNQRGL